MGTRSLTTVYGEDNAKIINMYSQMDGYPSGHGVYLGEFLAPFTIVNGLNSSQVGLVANGMGCLAAQLVAHFKTRPGGIYLYPAKATHCGQEYEYHIYPDRVVVKEGYDGVRMKTIITCTWQSLKARCEAYTNP